MTIYATWQGGTNYTHVARETDVEQFDGLAQAVQAFQDRYRLGHHFPQRFRYVHQPEQNILTPSVDENARMRIFDDDPTTSDAPHPSVVLSFGPRDRVMRTYPSRTTTA